MQSGSTAGFRGGSSMFQQGPSGKRPVSRTGFLKLPFQGPYRAAFYSNFTDSSQKSATSSEGRGFLASPSGNVPDFRRKPQKSDCKTAPSPLQKANPAISIREKSVLSDSSISRLFKKPIQPFLSGKSPLFRKVYFSVIIQQTERFLLNATIADFATFGLLRIRNNLYLCNTMSFGVIGVRLSKMTSIKFKDVYQ